MKLTKLEIDELIRVIGVTNEDEIDCEQCLSRVAEFAESKLEGMSVSRGLAALEQHLAVCAECREEYEVLQRALLGMRRD